MPEIDVQENLAAGRRYGLKPGDVRRRPRRWSSSEEVGDIFSGARAYDVHVWSTPEGAPQPDRHPQPADRHARAAAACDSPTSPTSASSRRRTSSSARTTSAASTSAPAWPERSLSEVVARRPARQLEKVDMPDRVPRGAAGRGGRRRRAPRTACCSSASPPRSGSSCCSRRPSEACASRCCSS